MTAALTVACYLPLAAWLGWCARDIYDTYRAAKRDVAEARAKAAEQIKAARQRGGCPDCRHQLEETGHDQECPGEGLHCPACGWGCDVDQPGGQCAQDIHRGE